MMNVIGKGYTDGYLSKAETRKLLNKALGLWDLDGQRVLVIIPDGTRTAPIPLFFRLLRELLHGKVAALDFMVALGTHQPMDDDALSGLVGAPVQKGQVGPTRIFNHRWDLETFCTLGSISADETRALSEGVLSLEVPVKINRKILDYERLIVCGPVFPHEVVGFSGGNKYFFPGVSGPELINFTHWLGALITSKEVIGTKQTPVRQAIDRAASLIPRPRLCLSLVVKGDGLAGLYAGSPEEAWSAAADLSAKLHVVYVERPFQRVLSVMPAMYDDIWTAAKGMYKLEPAIADGGEVVIYAPHIDEISYTHGKVIDQVGYHVRDYFVKQWEQFKHYPWGVLAHSTHLCGAGVFENGVEKPRIRVTLATGIPRERCERVNLGYLDPESVDVDEWKSRKDEGVLIVPKAGEMLYKWANRQMGK
jgi:nickel-dependent lactate racemase